MNIQNKFKEENMHDYLKMAKLLNKFMLRKLITTCFVIILCVLWIIIEPLRIHYLSPEINCMFALLFVTILITIMLYLFYYGTKMEKQMATIIQAFENNGRFYSSLSLSDPTYCGRAKRILRMAGFKIKYFCIIDISQITQ